MTDTPGSTITVRALLEEHGAPEDAALQRIVKAALASRRAVRPVRRLPLHDLWPPSSYELDRVTSFRQASESRRLAILERCARDRLEEAWFIEKLGLSFCSKMTLLAETTEERTLYALMSGDEAVHLQLVASTMDPPQDVPPFATLLGEIVESGTKAVLTMLVQVVLEGWGMHHYARLSRDCRDEEMQAMFAAILADEARHHGSGVLLLRKAPIPETDHAQILHFLERLLAMVRCGPQRVVAAVAPESAAAVERTFSELGDESTRVSLESLRRLIATEGPAEIARTLDRRGCFEAMPLPDCVALFQANRR